MADLPLYVERGGNIVMRQPIVLDDTIMFGFLMAADPTKLERLCDTVFTQPSRGRVRYRPLLPLVVAVCAHMGRCQSADPVHHQWGWSTETDFGFWVPLVGGPSGGPERVAWFLPYLFVDDVAAVVTGRETYGFPKQTATLRMPAGPADASEFSVETLVIERFTPDTEAVVAPLYTIRRPDAGLLGPLEHAWESAHDALRAVEGHLLAVVEEAGFGVWEIIRELISADLLTTVRMVLLKQFRDAADPTRACLQQIVEVPCTMRRWHGGGPLPAHEVSIRPCASHPIVEELGLAEQVVTPLLGFWTRFDFTLEGGKNKA